MSNRKDVLSLAEQGYDLNYTEHWDEIEFDEKQNHLELIDQRLKQSSKPNVQIRIGETAFDCHLLLLQCYSQLFDELGNQRVVELPEEKVTPDAFELIYGWMLAPKADVKRKHFVEVFVAAEYLRIPHLVTQCWICMDSTEALIEDRAFLLYVEATRFKQTVLQNMLLKRICRFFLPLVASKEFAQLPLDDLSTLLKSNYIGVFSEADIFYAVAVWLLEDWDNRSVNVSEVMKLVRFPLMRPSLLAELNSLDADERLQNILRHETTKYLVAQALTYAFTRSFSELAENRSISRRNKRLEMDKPMDRNWLEDPDHLEQEGHLDHNHGDCSYEAFLERLEHLTKNRDSWKGWRKVEMSAEILLAPSACKLRTPFVEHDETSGTD